LDDSICKYFPWFYGVYKGDTVKSFTIRDFLYQTSGIPFRSFDLIKEGDNRNSLETTIRGLAGIKLSNLPGHRFEYASINYDVLGLVIEKASGLSYESFIQNYILNKLGFSGITTQIDSKNKASGYKRDFFSLKEYKAPIFRGNVPAGYISSDIDDVEKWLYKNMDPVAHGFYDSLIQKSHTADPKMRESEINTLYGGGWFLNEGLRKVISHGGNNPNFSSFIAFEPSSQNGIAVLCNINSGFPDELGNYLLDELSGKNRRFKLSDTYWNIDLVSSFVIIISILFLLMSIYFLAVSVRKLFFGKVKYDSRSYIRNANEILICVLLLSFLGYCLYRIPDNLFNGLSWQVLDVWAPFNFSFAIKFLFIAFCVFFFYYIWSLPIDDRFSDQRYTLVVLSILSGLGNTLVIFSINSSMSVEKDSVNNYFLYFLLGIFMYLLNQRVCRIRLIKVSNNMIYEKRKEILNILFSSSFEKIEKINRSEIITVLNNDTMTISSLPNVLVGFISSLVTIIFCLAYLSVLNFYAFLGALIVLIIAVLLYVYVGKTAESFLQKNRTSQSVYMRFIYDLMNGLKELKLNNKKSADFANDLDKNNIEYRQTNSIANIKMASIFIIGEMLFTLVIGSIVFVMPLFVGTDDRGNDVRDFVFVFFYITGPVNTLLSAFPELMQIRVSWNRINNFKKSVLNAQTEMPVVSLSNKSEKFRSLELRDVEYEYSNTTLHEGFKVGPVSWMFEAGEITFITGGNGSGKSTLAKLLTGLYTPSSGSLLFNGKEMENEVLGQYYSTIFSDYHLFEKLYGIDHADMADEIDEKIEMLRLQDKVFIKDGAFSTSKLSSGQRKRLALLVSYLEDKSICLFDEWAADQDPEFRKYFYEVLLIELKRRNKCVIVISHDDAYYHIADKMMKLTLGKYSEFEKAIPA
jgi:cyclic peptide transporter